MSPTYRYVAPPFKEFEDVIPFEEVYLVEADDSDSAQKTLATMGMEGEPRILGELSKNPTRLKVVSIGALIELRERPGHGSVVWHSIKWKE